MKKQLSGTMAALLALGMLAGCAQQSSHTGSSSKPVHMSAMHSAWDSAAAPSFTEQEYEKLRRLQLDGYEDMSISSFQEKVWGLTDTAEYHSLLERFAQSESFYASKDSDPLASFFFYILSPLTSEQWQTREYGDFVKTDKPEPCDNAVLEFFFTFTVQDAGRLKVGDYNAARVGMTEGFEAMLEGVSDAQLQDEAYMQNKIEREAKQLTKRWASEKLLIETGYSYMPLSQPESGSGEQTGQQGQEERLYPNGTQNDYDSLLALKTEDYKELPLAEFNESLLEWANENYERMERVNGDIGSGDYQAALTEEEREFVSLTVNLSGIENGKYVQSNYTGRVEEDPSYQQYLPEKSAGGNARSAWCDLFYRFSYHIADKKTMTVGERDRCIAGVLSGIRKYWDQAKLEDLLKMEKADLVAQLQKIADAYSTKQLVITMDEDQVSFERMDAANAEQTYADAYQMLAAFKTKGYSKKSVADFYAMLAPDIDATDELFSAYALVMEHISKEDENYTFFDVTLQASLNELYCKVFQEQPFRFLSLNKKERPYGTDSDGDVVYEFCFYADAYVNYRICKPQALTVAERDQVLTAFCKRLQNVLDHMSEAEIKAGNIKKVLEDKAAAIAKELSSDKMKLSCEIGLVELF
ncbi:MAG: hypothetical protein K2N87_03730 [Eubacterium sp.]|nr:hypothetical protein [Eubacterium sp.]